MVKPQSNHEELLLSSSSSLLAGMKDHHFAVYISSEVNNHKRF